MLDARVAQQLREHRAQGVSAVQVVRAVARDDEDVLRAQTGDHEAQDVAARRVRPVQVLDDEHERRLRRPGRRDRGGDALEELEALALALLVVGRGTGVEQARERGTGRDRLVDGGVLGAQGRERLGEGEVGRPTSPRSTQWLHTTVAPVPAASSAARVSRRVLPTPRPRRRARRPARRGARSTAAASTSSSAARATKGARVEGRGTVPILAAGTDT